MSTSCFKLNSPLIRVFELSHQEIYISDCTTLQYVYFNPSALKNLQYTEEEVLKLTPMDVNLQFSTEEIREASKMLINTSMELSHSSIHTRKDGSNYHVDIQLQGIAIEGRSYVLALVQDTTEKHRVLSQLKAITEGSSVGYWEINLETNEHTVNDRWLEMLGYTRDEFDGRNAEWLKKVHPDDKAWDDSVISENLKVLEPYELDYRMQHKDGHWLWIHGTGAILEQDPVTNESILLCGIHLDISEIKQKEQEREQYLKLFNLSRDLMTISTLDDKKCLQVNPAVSKVLGYSPDEYMALDIAKIIHPDDLQFTQEHINKHKATGIFTQAINRMLHKDGSYRWLSWQANIDSDGNTIYSTGRDISSEIEAQEKLRSRELLYRTLAESTGEIITQFDTDRRHIYVNNVISKYYDLRPEDLLGKRLSEIEYFPKERLELMEACLEEAFVTGEPRSVYFTLEGKLGSRYLDWRASPIINTEGEVEVVFCISRDLSEHKLMEEEQSKVQKLTSLGVLAGGIAHDFNNILTILFGNISLAKSNLSEEHQSYANLQKAEEAFQRATHLTNQLLTFAKGGEPVLKNVSIASLVENVARFDLSGSNVKLEVEASKDLWMAQVDGGQIEQVFSNLTINANQSMPKGGELKISMENLTFEKNNRLKIVAGKYLKCTVQDSGTGIARESIEKIFDPYFSTRKSGSGLGLATVYSIINKHGGKISVSSRVGKGTCFTLYLPAIENGVVSDNSEQHLQSNPQGSKKLKVLIMDDEEMICKLATEILEKMAHQVDSAYTGEEAIRMFRDCEEREESYDVVIMDLTIPGGMGGADAIKELLSIDPAAKIIVSSGYAADPVMAHFENYGFKGVIAKPFTAKSLEDEMQKLFVEDSVS